MAKAKQPAVTQKFQNPMLAIHARRPGEHGDNYPNMTACLLPIKRGWIRRVRQVAEFIRQDARKKADHRIQWIKLDNAPASFLEGNDPFDSAEQKCDERADLEVLLAAGHTVWDADCRGSCPTGGRPLVQAAPLEYDEDLSLDSVTFIVVPGAQAEKCGSLTDARSAVFWVSDDSFYIAGTTRKYDDLDAESECLPLSVLDVLEAQL